MLMHVILFLDLSKYKSDILSHSTTGFHSVEWQNRIPLELALAFHRNPHPFQWIPQPFHRIPVEFSHSSRN
ncbi:hypothetical protein GALMADRAFT_257401, partial [Galerina marginata CBS 339.88]